MFLYFSINDDTGHISDVVLGTKIIGTVASGGTFVPASLALGGGETLYRAGVGETFSGDVLSTATKIADTTASESLLASEKIAHVSANVYDTTQFGHDFIEDPQMALTNLATSQLIGRTVGHLGQRFQAYRASKAADVNLGSGKAASYKGSIRERLGNSWTNVKTKVGNVRAQASQGWDDFKMKTANKMNQTLASGGEKLSKKLDNLNAKWGTQKQNFQRNLAAMQGGLVPEFQLAGGAPGIGVNPNFSESMENLSQKIQQFSVKRRQQIQDFEGVGGNSASKHLLNKDGIFDNPELEERYQKYVQGKQKLGIEADKIRDRLDWKEASDYYTQNSPIARGNRFNETVQDRKLYPYHEVHLKNGKYLDSYDPEFGEIISRKATDLDKIQEKTFRGYLEEIHDKYSVGETIRTNKYPPIDGETLEGKYILEIPESNKHLPNIERFKEIAKEYDVELRFTKE